MRRIISIQFLLFVSIAFVFANHSQEYGKALDYFEKHGVAYFSFPYSEQTNLDSLTKIISLSHKEGNLMYAYANPSEFADFLKQNIEYTIEKLPGETYNPNSVYEGDLRYFDGRALLNYDKYVELMGKYATDYPSICKLYTIGTSGKGKKMLALRMTNNFNGDEFTKKPRLLVGCAVHGDELNGTQIAYGLMDYLVKDANAKKYLDGLEIWVAPHLNPDGTFPNGNTMSGCKRENGSGVDLNRDYPAPNIYSADAQQAIERAQAETKASMEFEKTQRFNFAVDYHDAMNAIVLHWSIKTTTPVEMAWMKTVAGRYASAVGYDIGQAAVKWYPATGTRMDWQPYYNHCWGFTVECGEKGTSPKSTFSSHKSAILRMFDDAMSGICGIVLDKDSKGVDNVKVTLQQNGKTWDKDGTEAYSNPTGYYIHYAPAGTYDVLFTKDGKTQKKTSVTVSDGQAVKVDINIDGAASEISADNTAAAMKKFTIHSIGNTVVIHCTPNTEESQLSIYSVTGVLLKNFKNMNSTPSITLDKKMYSGSGCYIAKLTSGNKVYSQKFIFTK